MAYLFWLVLLTPALPAWVRGDVPAAAPLVLALAPDAASLVDGSGRTFATVRAPRVVDATLAKDGALVVLTTSGSGMCSLSHLTVAPTSRRERRDGIAVEGWLRLRSRRDLGRLKAWKVRLADVDGDGRQELLLGVFKPARFDPVPRNRLFVYDWPDLAPRWLGSRLSLPFHDFLAVDCDGDGRDDLVALEEGRGGRRRLMRYAWNGFGWTGEKHDVQEVFPASRLLSPHPTGARLAPLAPRRFCPTRFAPSKEGTP